MERLSGIDTGMICLECQDLVDEALAPVAGKVQLGTVKGVRAVMGGWVSHVFSCILTAAAICNLSFRSISAPICLRNVGLSSPSGKETTSFMWRRNCPSPFLK
jgi:hypothetical protein